MAGEGITVWLTGLSGTGKSTIAGLLADRLRSYGRQVKVFDGDVLRATLCKDLGFSRRDRDENIRRIGSLCKTAMRRGEIAIVAAVSPYRAARQAVRANISNFIEVYATCPLEVLIQRDPKGLYRRALLGEIPNFTGISDPYEIPEHPELTIDSSQSSPEEAVERIEAKIAAFAGT